MLFVRSCVELARWFAIHIRPRTLEFPDREEFYMLKLEHPVQFPLFEKLYQGALTVPVAGLRVFAISPAVAAPAFSTAFARRETEDSEDDVASGIRHGDVAWLIAVSPLCWKASRWIFVDKSERQRFSNLKIRTPAPAVLAVHLSRHKERVMWDYSDKVKDHFFPTAQLPGLAG